MILKHLRNGFVLHALPVLLYWVLRILFKTCKNRFHLAEGLSNTSFIMSVWHGEIAMMSFAYLRIKPKSDLSVIASQHFDGGLAAKLFECFGFEAIRGSSKKGGVKVLIEGIKRLKAGADIGITPDGPRGPRHSIADGVVALAQKTGVGVVACRVVFSNAFTLNTWDRFKLPKPFSTVNYYMFSPIFIPKEMDLQEAKTLLRQRMEAV
ncbi:lysophospholipid acyltransferase family protein [Helicobacter ailurogastricus]|uniref:lysophospholipid acyltransferase family protein n=1 Tax=Helicobacter ailurogastricus TaxID=1578720 RepID=UPI0022BF8694|nr:Putative lipoprotein [Helicobacter ailurogastricus]GLH58895.1 Putative lipoprotein [Helicobacter ailurogastricus]